MENQEKLGCFIVLNENLDRDLEAQAMRYYEQEVEARIHRPGWYNIKRYKLINYNSKEE